MLRLFLSKVLYLVMFFIYPAAIFACLFFSILFLTKKDREISDALLSIYFILHSISFVYNWIGNEGLVFTFEYIIWVIFGLSIVKTIVVYLYIKTYLGYKVKLNYLWHLLPVLFKYILVTALMFYYNSFDLQLFIKYETVSLSLFSFSSIFVLFYLILSFREVARFKIGIKDLRWLKFLILERVLMFAISIFLFVFYKLTNSSVIEWGASIIGFLLLVAIGLIGIKRGVIIGNAEILLEVRKENFNGYLSEGLNKEQVEEYKKNIKLFIKEKEPYLQEGYTISMMAKELGMPVNLLSKILNRCFNQSYSDFINYYRTESVISKMKDPAYKHYTLLAMAFASGFNSKASFNRVFKKITGETPSIYFNK